MTDTKFVDYVKITEIKNYVLTHLESMGLKEEVKVMSDTDLDKIIALMSLLGTQLKEKDSDDERVEMLIAYIVCLWTRLIVDYGVDMTEL